jgi:hypothetical protein
MTRLWTAAALAALCLAPPARADKPDRDKAPPKSFQVPYEMTKFQHIIVRAKINGKGPYNFILDTGAPALFISKEVGKKLGLKTDKKNWAELDRFEIEGGVVVDKAAGVVDTPFQLEGMNGLGLAGAEIHGVVGYNILARYRMQIDFTRDKMTWTPLDYTPMELKRMGGGSGGAGGLEIVGSLMKMMGGMLGTKAQPETTTRGFLGVELTDGGEYPTVKAVLAKGPAGQAGLKAGDVLTKFQGRTVSSTEDVLRFAKHVAPGDPVKLTVKRGSETVEVSFKSGEGF